MFLVTIIYISLDRIFWRLIHFEEIVRLFTLYFVYSFIFCEGIKAPKTWVAGRMHKSVPCTRYICFGKQLVALVMMLAAWLVLVVVAAPGNRNCYTWNRRLTAATNHMARDSVSPV